MEIPPLFNLTEKVALVSGASRGIGAAIAQILAEFGANVRSEERRVGKECRSRWSPYH